MKQVYIGTWPLGNRNVDLYGREGFGGDYDFFPDETSNGRITVSFDYEYWHEVLKALLHETGEFYLHDKGLLFKPVKNIPGDNQDRIFVFSHQRFTELNVYQGDFIAKCQNAACRAWRIFNKKKPMPVKSKKSAKKRKSAK